VYCFLQYQRGVGGAKEAYLAKKVKAVNPEKIKKIFSEEDKHSQFYPYIKTRRPIQWGGLSDEFDGFERKYGITYEILKYLREINYLKSLKMLVVRYNISCVCSKGTINKLIIIRICLNQFQMIVRVYKLHIG
jgi:hypothetical protein